jgi:cysteine sulfinate desulfinase/cysteine desulfurase-like protein
MWVKSKEIRRYILNQITPVFNSFLQNPGDIFPSGWEIEDMLEATRRKITTIFNTSITNKESSIIFSVSL